MEEQRLKFPCRAPLKVFGANQREFIDKIKMLVETMAKGFIVSEWTQKESKDHNYIALTIEIEFQNQTMYDSIHQAIHDHPDVKFVL